MALVRALDPFSCPFQCVSPRFNIQYIFTDASFSLFVWPHLNVIVDDPEHKYLVPFTFVMHEIILSALGWSGELTERSAHQQSLATTTILYEPGRP